MDFDRPEVERLALQDRDLLVCEGGEIGRTAIWRRQVPDCLYQNHIHRLRRRTPEIEPEFVMYWMQAAFLSLRLFGGAGNKTTIPNLSGARLKALFAPKPTVPEQREIAGVLARIQQAVELEDRRIKALKELKAATMAKVFREGLRGEELKETEIGQMPTSWRVLPVGELFDIQLGKMLSGKARVGHSPCVYLRNANVQWGHIDLSNLSRMDFSFAEKQRFALRPLDVLVCEGGEPGRAALWHGELQECFYQKALHRLRPRSGEVLPAYYVHWAFAAFKVLASHDYSGAKTTIAHLPAVKLAAVKMAVPDTAEQQRIVRVFDAVDSRIALAERRLASLRQVFGSALEQLMTGQLRVTPLLDSEEAPHA
jgi:type I restriction enzyme S subunit